MDYKSLFRKIDRALANIEKSEDLVATLGEMLRRLVDDFQEHLALAGGRIYALRGRHYVLMKEYPAGKAPPGFKIPVTYPPIRELLERGFILRDLQDPGVDRDIERALGVKVFAAIMVGDRGQQIMAFSLKPGSDPEHVVHTLSTIRHVINIKFRQEQLEDRVAEVRAIQLSLLPTSAPVFGDFDIWGSSSPAEEVGGDLYDFVPVGGRSLGIAVADSSGHGLPAALQARDAIIGLRMGVEERFRITATIEKLNRVVNHSALASKFISLFYGELDLNGTLVYCNAGHPPPLLFIDRSLHELSRGGMVLGPSPDALYERGYAFLEPGSVLLAYTDGITETESSAGEMFGVDRLRETIEGRRWTTARQLVEEVFGSVRDFAHGDPPKDDQTVVAVVRRTMSSRARAKG